MRKKTKCKKAPKVTVLIRLSLQVADYVREHGAFGESYNDTLKRLLKIK